ncbi:MAG: CRTAC1 family protein [Planctomycetes bacterium]|nr:CRTAC1 family protein [Planctomycetota bacterium]
MPALRRLWLPALALLVTCAGCNKERQEAKPIPKAFTDVAVEAGITHTHHKPVLDHKLDNIMPWLCTVGAAVAVADYDRDGWVDLYVTDSRKGTPNYLYRNNGDGTFTDVAQEAGVANLNGENGTSMDCVWGDYDNDGWPDLYVLRWGNDVLLRNNGDGTFTDTTAQCFRKRDGAKGTEWANGNAVIFWDYNLDGRLDLYVANYFPEVDLWHLENTSIMHDSFEKARNGGPNFLYRQNADGTFTEVAASVGLDDPGWSLAVGSADLNNDGWPDLYCADDFGPDQLFMSNRDGTFTNVTETAIGFDTRKGMNVDFGDFNEDGWLDIYVTNITTAEYLQEGNMLWHNNGPGPDGTISFTDIALETGTYDGGWGWGAKFFDYDHDGDLDLITVNGFISAGEGNYWYDLASWTVKGEDATDALNWPAIGDRSFSGYEKTRFWRNGGMFSFTQRAEEVGLDSDRDGRGIALLDYDNDGDLDLFVANQAQPPHLYRNNLTGSNRRLTVMLEGDPATGTNRDAIGARVTLVTPSGLMFRERDGGTGYCGQSDPRLHFGVGEVERIKLLEVRWPDGGLQYLEDVKTDQMVTIRQDPSRYASQLAIKVDLPKALPKKDGQSRPELPVVDPDELEKHLSGMETELRTRPSGYLLASTYRARCAQYGKHDRAIRFFQELVKQDPSDSRMRVELGCAYVDKIPTCGGVAAIVSKGTLALKALKHLDHVLGEQPDSWPTTYCRAMNHLHWPRALRHSDMAAVDFERCLKLQARDGAPNSKTYYVRIHIGLGDALAKATHYDRARKAWRAGLAAFPESAELKERLAIEDDQAVLVYIDSKRSLQNPIDTSLSFLDREP